MPPRSLAALACLAVVSPTAHAALSADAPASTGAWSFHHESVLGTSLDVTVRASSKEDAAHAYAALLHSMRADASLLSAWDSSSEFSRWAQTGGKTSGTPQKISPQLFEVLQSFDTWRERTGGALDASAEAALRLWSAATAEGRTPTAQEIAAARVAMQGPHWALDSAHGTATRLGDTPLALASFTKSYISSRAADAALAAGAIGVTVNVGGDIITRGDVTQVVSVADPFADAENDRAADQIVIRNCAVATSGSYRRGFTLAGAPDVRPQLSHIIDPRTAQPTGHIASSTVIAQDAVTAGALATAFSVLRPQESAALARRFPGTAYLLITQSGKRIESAGWASYQTGRLMPAAYTPAVAAPAAGEWDPSMELVIQIKLKQLYPHHYVVAWIEDEQHHAVRTIALWGPRPQYLRNLDVWYHQVVIAGNGEKLLDTVASATRSPGTYTVKWDGKDDYGRPVKAGRYTVSVQFAREHGTNELVQHAFDFNGTPQTASLGGAYEGSATADYRKKM